jgi:hypothetical protein
MHVATHFFLKCVILQAFFLLGIFGHEARSTTAGVTHSRQQQKHDEEPASSSSSYHHQQNRDHQEREKREAANIAARNHPPPAEQRQQQLNSSDILTSPSRLLEDMIVPTFTLSELQHGTTKDRDLLDVLATTGLLAIRVPTASIITKTDNTAALTDASAADNRIMEATEPNEDTLRRSRFFGELCRCSDKIGSQIHGGDKILLSDGVTTRSTIATATNGSRHPLPLPKEDIENICGPETLSSLERAREYVLHAASGAFIPALDRLIQNASASSAATGTAQYSSSTILLSTQATSSEHQRDYYSVSSIVDDSVNLEHFHVYSKKTKEQETASSVDAVIDHALDWHTDGGLFLAFLPAESCNHDVGTTSIIPQDDSFRIKKFHDPNNSESSFTEVRAVFPAQEQQDGEVIVAIMLGEGAEKWLNTPDSLKLRATRHAVKMKSGERRAWYGMMHLVPPNAIIKKSSGTTFSQMRKTSKAHVLVQDTDYVTTSSMFETYQGMASNQRNLVAHVGKNIILWHLLLSLYVSNC